MNPKDFFEQNRLRFFDDRAAVAAYAAGTEEAALVLRTADQVCCQIFLFQLRWDLEQTVEPVRFDGPIDWLRQPGNDPEFVYAFNRMRFWICLGQAYAITREERYAQAFASQLLHWTQNISPENPAHAKAWRSIEMGFRMDYWCRAISYFAGSPSITEDVIDKFLSSMRTHMEKIMGLWDSYQLMSNWGILANHGLFLASLTLPESEWTAKCQKEALRRLDEERRIQYYPDGVHWEQSPMYHNEMLRCFLDVVVLARRNHIELPDGFEEGVHRMALATLAMVKPDGKEPLMGDSDDIDCRDLITLAAAVFSDGRLKTAGYRELDFESVWELGIEEKERYDRLSPILPRTDYALSESGNFLFRSGWGREDSWVRFHCGTLGAGHGHADQLHFDFTAFGEDILTDLGRFTYVYGPDRREFKDGTGHNTILADHKDFYTTVDSWECSKVSRAINQKFYSDSRYGYAEGGHLGYYRDGIYVNRRLVFIKPDILILIDEFYAQGSHTYNQYFHWNSGAVTQNGSSICYTGTKASARMEILSGGAVHIEQKPGRLSRHYNFADTAPVTRTEIKGDGFTSVFTILRAGKAGDDLPLEMKKLPVYSNFKGSAFRDDQIEALRIRAGERCWVLAVAHEEYVTPTDTFQTDGCTGFGQVVIFDKAAGENTVGTRLAL